MNKTIKRLLGVIIVFCLITTTSWAAEILKPRLIINGKNPETGEYIDFNRVITRNAISNERSGSIEVSSTFILRNRSTNKVPGTTPVTPPEKSINYHAINKDSNKSYSRDLADCIGIAENTLGKFPSEIYSSISTFAFNFNETALRGSANSHYIELRCPNISESEMTAVLIHELGHIVDGGYLKGSSATNSAFIDLGKPVKIDDPSLKFYEISWLNENTKKPNSSSGDFCSLYGKTDPYEDFAECFILYTLHNEKFKKAGSTNEKLKAKYEFIKEYVFTGQTYDISNESSYLSDSVYDISKLPYNFSHFKSLPENS